MTVIGPGRGRTVRSVAALLLCVIVLRPAWPTFAQSPTPFGSLFNSAHTPENPTSDDIRSALAQMGTIAGHGSYMYEWPTGKEGMDFGDLLVSAFRAYGLKVFLQFAPVKLGQAQPPDGLAPSLWDPQVQWRYLVDVAHLASLHPDYLNLCAEADLIAAFLPSEWPAYVALYQSAYNLVKQISPNTQVGVSYHMDLFFAASEMWMPGNLGPYDYVAFTTYPSWIVHQGYVPNVSAIPSAFYDRVRLVFPTQEIIFSEVGWPSDGQGTPAQQADFVGELPRLMSGVRPSMVTWTTLSDTHYFEMARLNALQRKILEELHVDVQALFAQFNSMGLFDWNGAAKPAYTAARSIQF